MDLATRKVSSVPDEIVAPLKVRKSSASSAILKINSPEKDIFTLSGSVL